MTITLPVTERDNKKTAASLRSAGNVPAIVYGPKQEPIAISLEAKVFNKVLEKAGESTIVELTGLKESVDVLIKDVAFNPLKHEVTHVDFYAIEAGKEMTTGIALEFIGEAPVEQSRAGSVTKVLHEIEVTCKPKDLPSNIVVDMSSLVSIEDKILVKDLKVAAGVKIEADPEDPIAVVSVAKEEIEEEVVTEVDMDAIAVEQKGKEEEAPEEAAA